MLGTLALSLCLSGCAIPVYDLVSPSGRFTIRDETGKPLAGARVSLIEFDRLGPFLHATTKLTGADGAVAFESRGEFKVIILGFPDATSGSVWEWCIRHPGFQTPETITDRFGREMLVTLRRGVSSECVSKRGRLPQRL